MPRIAIIKPAWLRVADSGRARAARIALRCSPRGCWTCCATGIRSWGNSQTVGRAAMKGADFVWDKEKLDSFIAKPDEVVPGNSMKPYGGLASAEDRSKLIAFLQSPGTN
jgi:cytochrome c1